MDANLSAAREGMITLTIDGAVFVVEAISAVLRGLDVTAVAPFAPLPEISVTGKLTPESAEILRQLADDLRFDAEHPPANRHERRRRAALRRARGRTAP